MVKKCCISVLVLCILWGCASMGGQYSDSNKKLVLKNCRLIDGTGGNLIDNAIILIENDKIIDLGTTSDLIIPIGAEVYDLKGATVLPGFINTHIHNGFNEDVLKQFAQAGITTVRDLQDNSKERLDNWSWFIERDKYINDPFNSRLLSSGQMITVPRGYPIYYNDQFIEMGMEPELALVVKDTQEAEVLTQKLIDLGADVIKISIENGVTYLTPETLGYRLPTLSKDQVGKIVEVAHKNGIRVTAHISNSEDIPLFIEAGGDEIAHMVVDGGLTDGLVKSIVDAGIYWIPTLELWRYVEHAPMVKAVDPDYQSYLPAMENLKKFVNAGGKVALGTDFAGIPGDVLFQYMPMIEIKSMIECGMSPMDVIVASTKNSALACGIADVTGTVEKGKLADLLIVDGNPLDDIDSLEKPLMVMRSGTIIRNEY